MLLIFMCKIKFIKKHKAKRIMINLQKFKIKNKYQNRVTNFYVQKNHQNQLQKYGIYT